MSKWYFAIVSLLMAWPLSAFEDSALWLPASYQKLAPELRQAAKKMEAMDSCQKVLRGYLHDSSQSMESAVFMIVCRAPNRKTHSVLVDAHTLEVEYPLAVEVEPRDLDAELKERIDNMWETCQSLYKKKTKFMRNLTTLTEGRPKPQIAENNEVTLVINFDAESLQGNPLHYRANCLSVDEETPIKLSIVARK